MNARKTRRQVITAGAATGAAAVVPLLVSCTSTGNGGAQKGVGKLGPAVTLSEADRAKFVELRNRIASDTDELLALTRKIHGQPDTPAPSDALPDSIRGLMGQLVRDGVITKQPDNVLVVRPVWLKRGRPAGGVMHMEKVPAGDCITVYVYDGEPGSAPVGYEQDPPGVSYSYI